MATFLPSLDHLDDLRDRVPDELVAVARGLAVLDDGWTVYLRPQLGLETADLLLVHDQRGVIVVAVDRGDHRERLVPTAARLRGTVYEQFYSLPGAAREPGTAVRAVVVSATETAEEFRTLLGSVDPGVAVCGREVVDGDLDILLGPPAHPAWSESVRRLRRQVVAAGIVHDAITPVQLSANARMVVGNARGTKVRGVTGPAGSGKTFALTARAARLAAEGKQVLVLCFNSTLAHRLRQLVVDRCAEFGGDPTLVLCANFHNFCARVVDAAAQAGILADEPARGTWPVKIVAKAEQVLAAGFECRFDAVFVDEGQDFSVEWWNLLRTKIVRSDGEMLLAADPSVDIYDKQSWSDPDTLRAAGFTEPWIEMASSYRMAPELIEATNLFARTQLDGDAVVAEVPLDQAAVVGTVSQGVRSWTNVERVADLGSAIGHEVVRLLTEAPGLEPKDVVYLCEYHHDGLAAAAVIEAAGFRVHHVYSRDPDERHRRKARFWPDADAVKGCTVHSFKGWESPAVVLGIGMEERSRRLAYGSMTRVTSTGGTEASHLAVVNADPRLVEFGEAFVHGVALTVDA